MTVHLDWPADIVARLKEEARQKGLSLDEYILQTILEKAQANSGTAGELERRSVREKAGRTIRELRAGNVLGPDISLRDLIEEGRRY